MLKIAITGHRPNKLGGDYALTSNLTLKIKEKLQELVNQYKPDVMISGMALGIDTLWAKLAHENEIKLIAAIPCAEHDSVWKGESKKTYKEILSHPLTTIHQVSEFPYTSECMQERNEWMVDNCDLLIAVWDGSNGGTGNCVSYAKSQEKTTIIIDPNEVLQASIILEALNKKNE